MHLRRGDWPSGKRTSTDPIQQATGGAARKTTLEVLMEDEGMTAYRAASAFLQHHVSGDHGTAAKGVLSIWESSSASRL
jgi:hypothetical protein